MLQASTGICLALNPQLLHSSLPATGLLTSMSANGATARLSTSFAWYNSSDGLDVGEEHNRGQASGAYIFRCAGIGGRTPGAAAGIAQQCGDMPGTCCALPAGPTAYMMHQNTPPLKGRRLAGVARLAAAGAACGQVLLQLPATGTGTRSAGTPQRSWTLCVVRQCQRRARCLTTGPP